jgi:uncharacterized protein (DUF362 family)
MAAGAEGFVPCEAARRAQIATGHRLARGPVGKDKLTESDGDVKRERVSVVRCAADADDATVVRRAHEAVRCLGDDLRPLAGARKIAVKINAGVNRVVLTGERQTELTDPAVVEGTLRALREVTDAEIVIGDAPTDRSAENLYTQLGYPERLARFKDVRLHDFGHSELVETAMPHAEPMFRSYNVPRELTEADAIVSIAKMKAHTSVGCTLCIKNLFGWLPTSVYGTPRVYLHDRLVRLPRVLADLALWLRPSLNVIDGIVAANKSEWRGEALAPGVIAAGTNIVATDSVGARLMGFDPCGDYPAHPFFYRRNPIRLAADAGLGPCRPEQIEVLGPCPEEIATPFTVHRYEGDTRREEQLRRGAACVARYQERQDDLADRYGDRFLALSDGEVLWDGPDVATMQRLETESGRDWQSAPQLMVRCLPRAREVERMEWYARDAGCAV